MNRLVLALFALLGAAAVFVALAPPVYHALFCRLCRRMREMRRAAR